MKILIIFLLFINLYADDYENHSNRHINKELSHINLSKKQNKEIKKILKEFRAELKEYRELKETIEDKRKDLFLEEVFDKEALNRLNLRLYTKAREIENALLKKIHSMLNSNQRVKFIDYFDDWEVD